MTTFKTYLPWIIVAALIAFILLMGRKAKASRPADLAEGVNNSLPGGIGGQTGVVFPKQTTGGQTFKPPAKPGWLPGAPTIVGAQLVGKSIYMPAPVYTAPPAKPKTTVGVGGL